MTGLMLSFLMGSFLLFFGLFLLIFGRNKETDQRVNYYLDSESAVQKIIVKKPKRNFSFYLKELNQWLKEKLTPNKTNQKVELFLQSAGVSWTAGEYIIYRWMIAIISGGILYLLSEGNLVLLPMGGLLGSFIPRIMVNNKRQKRIKKFNDQLADMMTSMISSLRAGFSFVQALKAVEEEADSPVKEEMALVLKELQYGSNLEDALSHLYARVPSKDLDIMIQAILIQRQVGGNLATILDNIVDTIRERNKIHRQVKTLTAQGKLSGMVIGLMPFALGFIIYLIQPSYVTTLFTTSIGIILVSFAFVSGIIGFLLIQKLTKIEV